MKTLIENVLEWSEVKGIPKHSTALSQRLYAIGELCNEFRDAIAKNKSSDEIKTELGDVLVFYINYLVMSNNMLIIDCIDKAEGCTVYDNINDIDTIIIHGLEDSGNGEFTIIFFEMLHAIAKRLNTTLEECLQLAYDKISKRKGQIQNGKLVKEGD